MDSIRGQSLERRCLAAVRYVCLVFRRNRREEHGSRGMRVMAWFSRSMTQSCEIIVLQYCRSTGRTRKLDGSPCQLINSDRAEQVAHNPLDDTRFLRHDHGWSHDICLPHIFAFCVGGILQQLCFSSALAGVSMSPIIGELSTYLGASAFWKEP